MPPPMSGRAQPSVPGFSIKGSGTRLGARIAAARATDGTESESSSRVVSARSTQSKLEAQEPSEMDKAALEEEKRSWLELQRAEEVRKAAIEEKEKKVLTRRLNLKVSKYKIEIQEASKVIDDLVDSTKSELYKSDDIVDLAMGLVEAEEGRLRRKPKTINEDNENAAADAEQGEAGLIKSVKKLSQVTMKIIARKGRLEDIIKMIRSEYKVLKTDYEKQMTDIRDSMKKLALDKENAEFNLQDRSIQYETKLRTLKQDYADASEKLQVCVCVVYVVYPCVIEQGAVVCSCPPYVCT